MFQLWSGGHGLRTFHHARHQIARCGRRVPQVLRVCVTSGIATGLPHSADPVVQARIESSNSGWF